MVYVVHQHTVARGGERVNKYDFTEAEKFGAIVYLLGDDAQPGDPSVAETLVQKLEHFSDTDYLLLVGSPVFIGLAFAVAAEYNDGRVKVLQWSGQRGYVPIDIKF